MRNIGFSSGALALGDFQRALKAMEHLALPCLELSALRMEELGPLLEAVPLLALKGYDYVSIHAPGKFSSVDEAELANLLLERVPEAWPIVLHPDAIYDFGCWKPFGRRLAIENMDRRKPCGRNVAELEMIFSQLPDASLCFDIGHARQYDSSMTEAFLILTLFAKKLVQVHISEVNSASQHDPISYGAKLAFQQVAGLIPTAIPVIVESRVGEGQIRNEIQNALESLDIGQQPTKSEELQNIFAKLSRTIHAFSNPMTVK